MLFFRRGVLGCASQSDLGRGVYVKVPSEIPGGEGPQVGVREVGCLAHKSFVVLTSASPPAERTSSDRPDGASTARLLAGSSPYQEHGPPYLPPNSKYCLR